MEGEPPHSPAERGERAFSLKVFAATFLHPQLYAVWAKAPRSLDPMRYANAKDYIGEIIS